MDTHPDYSKYDGDIGEYLDLFKNLYGQYPGIAVNPRAGTINIRWEDVDIVRTAHNVPLSDLPGLIAELEDGIRGRDMAVQRRIALIRRLAPVNISELGGIRRCHSSDDGQSRI